MFTCAEKHKYEACTHHTSNGGVYNINVCIEYIYPSEPYAIDKTGLCINGIKLYNMYQTAQQEACQSPKNSSSPSSSTNLSFEESREDKYQGSLLQCYSNDVCAFFTIIINEHVHMCAIQIKPICTEIHISDSHTVGLSIPSQVPQSNLTKVSIRYINYGRLAAR